KLAPMPWSTSAALRRYAIATRCSGSRARGSSASRRARSDSSSSCSQIRTQAASGSGVSSSARSVSGIPVLEDQEGADAVLDLPVSRVMNTDLKTVSSEDDLDDAIELMVEHRIGAVPVIDPSTNGLVGIVSTIDALRVLRQMS